MFKPLTIPVLSGALSLSVVINILLIKRIKKYKTDQYLESTDRFLTLSNEDNVIEEEVDAGLAFPLMDEEVQDQEREQ